MGVSQWDVDLNLHVLSVNTSVKGYVMQNDSTLSANVTTSYQFKAAKPEQIHVVLEMERKHAHEEAQGAIKCTAYPFFNINWAAKYMVMSLSSGVLPSLDRMSTTRL